MGLFEAEIDLSLDILSTHGKPSSRTRAAPSAK
jgi:hypothetical protein